ncbi:MAG TPA: 4'-phosphopantetheinyl transferase superfamily protein [Polyangiaceae bacterium]|nr:4'-phosphopantetheinyl transferase superfamily protein [Polyangiaceae bacterium]
MTTARATISRSEVHLWCAAWHALTDPDLLARYEALLTDEERTAHRRFYFEEGRREYLMTRALVRDVLSRYEPNVDPAAWRFVRSAYGRPSLAPEMGPRDLEFNLSNTKGLVVCAISRDQVGVDVEPRARGTSVVPIADTVFSQDELAALRALPESEQPRRAIELWTLKESFIKARGLGLSLPLDRFTMLLDADRISIRIDPSIAIPGERWQFALLQPTEEHLVALALERGPRAEDKSVAVRTIVPLVSEG